MEKLNWMDWPQKHRPGEIGGEIQMAGWFQPGLLRGMPRTRELNFFQDPCFLPRCCSSGLCCSGSDRLSVPSCRSDRPDRAHIHAQKQFGTSAEWGGESALGGWFSFAF